MTFQPMTATPESQRIFVQQPDHLGLLYEVCYQSVQDLSYPACTGSVQLCKAVLIHSTTSLITIGFLQSDPVMNSNLLMMQLAC